MAKVIKKGASGSHIKILQEALNELLDLPEKSMLAIDGKLGPAGEKALIVFQKKYGIKDESGFVGPKTLAKLILLYPACKALSSYVSAPDPKKEAAKEEEPEKKEDPKKSEPLWDEHVSKFVFREMITLSDCSGEWSSVFDSRNQFDICMAWLDGYGQSMRKNAMKKSWASWAIFDSKNQVHDNYPKTIAKELYPLWPLHGLDKKFANCIAGALVKALPKKIALRSNDVEKALGKSTKTKSALKVHLKFAGLEKMPRLSGASGFEIANIVAERYFDKTKDGLKMLLEDSARKDLLKEAGLA